MRLTDLVSLTNPKSPISEAYRTLRTNIQFSSLDKDIKTITITSSMPGEGKTTTISNLAITMAQSGNKVLLIDCDLRKSRVHKQFGLSNHYGLTNTLVQHLPFDGAIKKSSVEGLHILTAGPKPPNPSELIGSNAMREFIQEIGKNYDRILIDTPPVTVVTDAAILSSLTDATILVVASEQSSIEVAQRAKKLLLNVNANIIGVVINKTITRGRGYYSKYYYNYYEDTNETGSSSRKKRKKEVAISKSEHLK